jgi:hemolysin activation/secretion protein
MFRGLAGMTALGIVLGLAAHAAAQQKPNAGRVIQDMREAPAAPRPSPAILPEQPSAEPSQPGGPRVTVRSIVLQGNSRFTDAVLLAQLADAPGHDFDLAGLKALADRLTDFYHRQGYPFARALIPQQSMADGVLTVAIVEGRYGDVKVVGADDRDGAAERFLGGLQRGAVIRGEQLERTSLILDDQPGYKFVPVIRPGHDVGSGDLLYRMDRDQRFGGSVTGDNRGNRYTGRYRSKAELYANSPFMLGDQINVSGIYTDEDMWSGSLGYNLPLGYSGLRGTLGYIHTYYQLGKEFSSLDAYGTADVASAGLSYPLVRSQKANLSLSGNYQQKWLTDEQGSAGTVDRKSSSTFPLTLSFDRRDGFGGGGLTYGALSWTHGILRLGDSLKTSDSTTARSNGGFDKFNLDIVRLQALPVDNLTLYARGSFQTAADNLDSSEDFGLGGPDGIRAYPVGEAYGDEGALTQIELRYAIGTVVPYAFYDYGYSRTNHDPWNADRNRRALSGNGLGVRAAYAGLSADLSVAWRGVGGAPTSDPKADAPMWWLSLGYKF